MVINTYNPFRYDKPSKDEFVNRENYIKAFWDALERVKTDRHQVTVLHFYGVGGIGKTYLRDELKRQLIQRQPNTVVGTLDFTSESNRLKQKALECLCADIKKRHKVKFDIFGLAYAAYMEKLYPMTAINKKTVPFLEEGDFLTEAIDAAKDVPGISLIPKVMSLQGKFSSWFRDERNKQKVEVLQRLSYMEPHSIAEKLPRFFAMDVYEHIEEKGTPVVIFIDTYEALWEKDKARSDCPRDHWLHEELIRMLPGILWVVCGRERLRWDEGQEYDKWEGSLTQMFLGNLSERDARHYLSLHEITDVEIQQKIVENTEGVPFYLSLSKDTYNEIKNNRTPTVYDFKGDKTPQRMFERFIRNLEVTERETIYILSVTRFWNYDIFKALIKEFNTGYPLTMFGEMSRFSFMNSCASGEGLEMHSIMRKSLHDYMPRDVKKLAHEFMFGYYRERLDVIDIKSISVENKIALQEAYYHGACQVQNEEDAEKFAQWFFEKAKIFYEAAQWELVVPLYLEMKGFLQDLLGKEHQSIAIMLNNLAELYKEQGKYEEAEPLYKRALEICETVLGEENPLVATILNNLALLYFWQGKYEEAEPLYKRALEISERVLGKEHPDVATTLNNLAGLNKVQGKYEEAEPLYKRALEINESMLGGEEYLSTATTLNNLAELYYWQGKYEEAEPLYKRALEISERVLGEEHPSIAITLNNLAQLYKEQGEYKEAEILCKRALEISEKMLGKEHPSVGIMLNNLAVLYKAQEKYEEVESLYKRDLEISEKVLGKEHPSIAVTLNNLAQLYKEQGKYKEAELLYKRALEINGEALGKWHPDVAITLTNLALLYELQGKLKKAEPIYKRVVEILFMKRHHNLMDAMDNLVNIYIKLGKQEEEILQIIRKLITKLLTKLQNGEE
ncbi:MAG: tetratricopeptide repeat protein [Clostridia bacterium]|nr:tetratricopeptide repeat protein [Clostridia bacterium]